MIRYERNITELPWGRVVAVCCGGTDIFSPRMTAAAPLVSLLSSCPSPICPPCCVHGRLCKMKIKPCYSPKKLLITLNRNSNALHHCEALNGLSPAYPAHRIGCHSTPSHPKHWSPLSLCNTMCPSHLGASAQNDLPSSSMPNPLEVVGEAFTDTRTPI